MWVLGLTFATLWSSFVIVLFNCIKVMPKVAGSRSLWLRVKPELACPFPCLLCEECLRQPCPLLPGEALGSPRHPWQEFGGVPTAVLGRHQGSGDTWTEGPQVVLHSVSLRDVLRDDLYPIIFIKQH